MPFEETEFEIQRAIARHEGLPFLPKKAEINSQPIANPVPLADTPGYTAGGADIETTLENAPSAIGTGKTSNEDGGFAISIEGDPEIINSDLIEDITDAAEHGSIEDVIEDVMGDIEPLNDIFPMFGDKKKKKKDSKIAGAHKVEKDGDKFYVVEDKGEKAAGPFDSQEEAYARANELNDLENLEKEGRITPAMKIARKMMANKKCQCWDGYERVPGTKPCAPGSCRKCDTHAKKESAKTAFEYTFPEGQIEEETVDPATEQLQAQFENWFNTQPFPDELRTTCLGDFDQAYQYAQQNNPNFDQMNPEAQLRALIEAVFRIFIGGPKFEGNFPPTPNNNPILGKVADTQEQISQFILKLNQDYRQLCESMGVIKPPNAGILPDGRISQPTPDLQRGGVRTAPAILIDSSFDPGQRPNLIANGIDPANLGLQPLTDEELETFQMSEANRQYAQSLPNSLKQLGYNTKVGSQGDKPSPHAAQAVLAALKAGNEEEAKELLKTTDCPEGCETHPEGKCNHQYMSAGRTRVRYLINDSSFDESEGSEAFADEPVEIKE